MYEIDCENTSAGFASITFAAYSTITIVLTGWISFPSNSIIHELPDLLSFAFPPSARAALFTAIPISGRVIFGEFPDHLSIWR